MKKMVLLAALACAACSTDIQHLRHETENDREDYNDCIRAHPDFTKSCEQQRVIYENDVKHYGSFYKAGSVDEAPPAPPTK